MGDDHYQAALLAGDRHAVRELRLEGRSDRQRRSLAGFMGSAGSRGRFSLLGRLWAFLSRGIAR